jgi:hypothetical protein
MFPFRPMLAMDAAKVSYGLHENALREWLISLKHSTVSYW